VQHRPPLAAVDGFAREQGVALGRQRAGLGHLQQQGFGVAVPEVLGQIGKHMGCALAEVLEAPPVLGKGLAQIKMAAPLRKMGLQQRPLRSLVTRDGHGG
jgi:hypothetical protein